METNRTLSIIKAFSLIHEIERGMHWDKCLNTPHKQKMPKLKLTTPEEFCNKVLASEFITVSRLATMGFDTSERNPVLAIDDVGRSLELQYMPDLHRWLPALRLTDEDGCITSVSSHMISDMGQVIRLVDALKGL